MGAEKTRFPLTRHAFHFQTPGTTTFGTTHRRDAEGITRAHLQTLQLGIAAANLDQHPVEQPSRSTTLFSSR
ncbi:hypothetical protein SAMN02745166_01681 [Prosthecobacter debontii]|uniref:Uncharacterized protein n=1 Tax=Prosthecobacter debontii TaxID=48467 RepID=A0A1T4XLI4_9BACT|nr:hypothetical protein SAMN02745166_01681 [Prosthecobacter debontii]